MMMMMVRMISNFQPGLRKFYQLFGTEESIKGSSEEAISGNYQLECLAYLIKCIEITPYTGYDLSSFFVNHQMSHSSGREKDKDAPDVFKEVVSLCLDTLKLLYPISRLILPIELKDGSYKKVAL